MALRADAPTAYVGTAKSVYVAALRTVRGARPAQGARDLRARDEPTAARLRERGTEASAPGNVIVDLFATADDPRADDAFAGFAPAVALFPGSRSGAQALKAGRWRASCANWHAGAAGARSGALDRAGTRCRPVPVRPSRATAGTYARPAIRRARSTSISAIARAGPGLARRVRAAALARDPRDRAGRHRLRSGRRRRRSGDRLRAARRTCQRVVSHAPARVAIGDALLRNRHRTDRARRDRRAARRSETPRRDGYGRARADGRAGRRTRVIARGIVALARGDA